MSAVDLLVRLGFSSADRVVVLHADDIGMCGATVAAYRAIAARGVLSSASVMVPCGWFPAAARAARDLGGRADMGVHLTLTSEWSDYRWGPISGDVRLCDADGYLPARAEDARRRASLEAVERELRAQVARAERAGIDVTHLDSHMFTLADPTLAPIYARLSEELRIPCCVLAGPNEAPPASDRHGPVVFDTWAELPLRAPADRLETGKRILDRLPSGLSYVIAHPAVDTPEIRAIAPDWEARVADYHLYMDDAWAKAVERAGVHVIGMRALRSAIFGLEQRDTTA